MGPSLQRLVQHGRDEPAILRLARLVHRGSDRRRHHRRPPGAVPEGRVRPPSYSVEKAVMTATHAAPITKRRRWRAFCADRSGATAVEFALIGAPFIALLVALIQTFLVFFAQQLLEQVVIQASRTILTGQAQAQSLSQSQFASVVCSNVTILFNCSNLMIDVQVAGAWSSANAGPP